MHRFRVQPILAAQAKVGRICPADPRIGHELDEGATTVQMIFQNDHIMLETFREPGRNRCPWGL
jgi:hypothetical protein